MYVLKERSYFFRTYLDNNPYYEITAEEWYPQMHLPSSVMESFNLACKEPFWPYKAKRRRQQLIPTQYRKVDITKCLSMPPYAISNPLGRLADHTTNIENCGYMAIGSARVYTPRWIQAEPLDLSKKVWCEPTKNPHAIVRRDKTPIYRYVKEGVLELIKYTRSLGPGDYYTIIQSPTMTSQAAVHTAAGALRLYEQPRIFYRDKEAMYAYETYASPTTQSMMRIFVPVPNAFVNKYGEILITDGLPMTEWVYIKRTITNYDAYRCYVSTYGGPVGSTATDILATMSFADATGECESLVWDG